MSFKDIPGYNQAVLPYHLAQSAAAGVRYKFPGRRLRIIGVTGTNGKTTTSFMIWKMLNFAGHKTGLMTTVAWGGFSEDELEKQIEHMTTVDAMTLNRRITKIADLGAEFLVLEVTSHALAQFRILGIPIEVAVMTNVTHEHLDYHKTFSRYVKAKTKLFSRARFGVVNVDDPSADAFISALPSSSVYVTYGIKNKADERATSVKLGASGVKYVCDDINVVDSKVVKVDGKLSISTQIPGEFNVYNSLAAVSVGQILGLTPGQIEKGILALSEVEGRMNRLSLGQDFEVIVDFAHTPDAFLKVFSSVCPHPEGRVISLFGGAGRRDESTRAERGEIAGKYSDLIIVTEDDSRDEDPFAIASEFVSGAKKAGLSESKIIVELDRSKAISRAISEARAGDLVLILGKGHEKTILRADGPHKFEDLKVTEAAIKKRLNG
ncbi:UDP-N-acetylmuramoyl-L-alanyl-D-glutamate--2,6-diaminopimelate ligase [Candidatus Saccharibacteria bacterium]|nr:UDP-N-acetylmuramoyl-L-alanyl-D-glutamate--2,6-diaminopimelate ligase [Candidatus Saccharibacteria bacterium]